MTRAPELCITDPSDDPLPVTKATDVWGSGKILFCMLCARMPHVDNGFVVMRMIADEEIHIPGRRFQPINQTSAAPSKGRTLGRPVDKPSQNALASHWRSARGQRRGGLG